MKFTIALMLVALGVANAAIPSKFSKAGGPNDVRGVWYVPDDGSVFIQSGDSYNSAYQGDEVDFGKYTSYECTGKGTYRAIVKSKVITADGKEETSTTCEIGKVDLAAGTYKFAASANKCPTEYTDKSIRAGPYDQRCSLQCT